ncbi:MAG: biopolymer transporter ExbD [Gemmatimonadota bacterium]|jgi:biopolymer transport protein ExbD/biopolymer transport protein TolR
MQRSLRRARRRGLPVNAEIQITNLVDVAFVLLIIFMITAPILQGGIELDLPNAEAAPLTDEEGVMVSIARDGTIFVGEAEMGGLEEFRGVFGSWLDAEQRTTYVRADAAVSYGVVVQVLAIISGMGVTDLSLVLEPEETNR